jgi:hypothetical protein
MYRLVRPPSATMSRTCRVRIQRSCLAPSGGVIGVQCTGLDEETPYEF